MTEATPIKIFVGYAQENESDLNQLFLFAEDLKRDGIVVFADTKIIPGEEWEKRILYELQTCHIAVFLITQHFVASGFCMTQELPLADERSRRGECKLLLVRLGVFNTNQGSLLKSRQWIPRGEPIRDRSITAQEHAWNDVVDELRRQVDQLRRNPSKPTPPSEPRSVPPREPIQRIDTDEHKDPPKPWMRPVVGAVIAVLLVVGLSAAWIASRGAVPPRVDPSAGSSPASASSTAVVLPAAWPVWKPRPVVSIPSGSVSGVTLKSPVANSSVAGPCVTLSGTSALNPDQTLLIAARSLSGSPDSPFFYELADDWNVPDKLAKWTARISLGTTTYQEYEIAVLVVGMQQVSDAKQAAATGSYRLVSGRSLDNQMKLAAYMVIEQASTDSHC